MQQENYVAQTKYQPQYLTRICSVFLHNTKIRTLLFDLIEQPTEKIICPLFSSSRRLAET